MMTARQKRIQRYVDHKLAPAVLGATEYSSIAYYGDGRGESVQLVHIADNPRKRKKPMLRVDVSGLDELGVLKAVVDAL